MEVLVRNTNCQWLPPWGETPPRDRPPSCAVLLSLFRMCGTGRVRRKDYLRGLI